MTMSEEMRLRLELAAEAEGRAHADVVAQVAAARAAGGSLREIGAAIGRSHTEVNRMVARGAAEASR